MTIRSVHMPLLLAALMLALALLAECSTSADFDTRQYQPQDRPYFTGSIPPCTPVEGGAADPCEIRPATDSDTDRPSTVDYAPPADTPRPAAHLMGFSNISATHLVLRVTFLPGTVSCELRDTERAPNWSGLRDLKAEDGELGKITCYGDVRVNEYILGTGPPTLTLVMGERRSFRESVSDREAKKRRRAAENDLVQGDDSVFDWVPEGGMGGLELIQFVGPASDYGIETLQSFGGLRLNRKEDGTVVVLHPYWDYWSRIDYERYRSQIEWSLADFKTLMAAAHQQRVTDWGGRVGPDTYVPVAHTDANTLHDFYVNIGAYDHPDGPPVLPPVTCGPAVRHPSDNHGLVLDCRTLLDVKGMLRGTAELDWSMDTRIAKWDGVKVAGTPQRVTKVELEDRGLGGGIPAQLRNITALTHLDLSDNSLTGSVPTELAELAGLEELRLSGNSLTGCIPVALRNVPTNDLDDVGLPDCP